MAGRRINVGADRYMRRLGIDLASVADDAVSLAEKAKSPLYVAVDGRLAALIAVADPLKDGSVEAIAALKSSGLSVAMLTGDNRATAEAIARQAGIERVLAEVLPDQKAAEVKRLQDEGARVALWVTVSMTHRPWRKPMWVSPSAPVPTLPSRPATWF